jgi:hypothetical protein
VLDLSGQASDTPARNVRELSPKLSAMYADKTDKTIMRDLNELCKAELIEKTDEGYRARRELILAFLPARSAAVDADAQP